MPGVQRNRLPGGEAVRATALRQLLAIEVSPSDPERHGGSDRIPLDDSLTLSDALSGDTNGKPTTTTGQLDAAFLSVAKILRSCQ
jgi:hypothetical protein